MFSFEFVFSSTLLVLQLCSFSTLLVSLSLQTITTIPDGTGHRSHIISVIDEHWLLARGWGELCRIGFRATQLNDYTIIERILIFEILDFDLILNIKKKSKDMFPNFRGLMDRIKRLFGETFYKNMTLFNCLDFG